MRNDEPSIHAFLLIEQLLNTTMHVRKDAYEKNICILFSLYYNKEYLGFKCASQSWNDISMVLKIGFIFFKQIFDIWSEIWPGHVFHSV